MKLNFPMMKRICLTTAISLLSHALFSQTFSKTSLPFNQIQNNFNGIGFADIDNDGDLDIFSGPQYLFEFTGSEFIAKTNSGLALGQSLFGSASTFLAGGVSWGDFDNDGDLDCLLAGKPTSLYENDGTGKFKRITLLSMSEEWGASFGDYNNDGYLDIITANPIGFLGNGAACVLLKGNRNRSFSMVSGGYEFTSALTTYTNITWSDYDNDGDIDLFIASGPGGAPAVDRLYKNTLIENGTEGFERISGTPLATDQQDGQTWNFIDADNDGDLDAFITNWSGATDHFYLNDNGNYVQTSALSQNQSSLSNVWGDIDNDGDLDVIVTGSTLKYYRNNGDATFSLGEAFQTNFTMGATLGDFDRDGDLDFAVNGAVTEVYENQLSNNNGWLVIQLKGTMSNRAAIGARVKVQATIGGQQIWMQREIQAQNSFIGMNALDVHFGMGDAIQADSIVVLWPSGAISSFKDQSIITFMQIEEPVDEGFIRVNFRRKNADVIQVDQGVEFEDLSVVDPNLTVTYEWDFNNDGTVDSNEENPTYSYSEAGNYTVKLTITDGTNSDTYSYLNYVKVNPVVGIKDRKNDQGVFRVYPNPFDHEVQVSYELDETSLVSINVYDVYGRLVDKLQEEQFQPPGNYQINWGKNAENGFYMMRISINSKSEIFRVMKTSYK